MCIISNINTAMPYIQGIRPVVHFVYIGFVVFSARAQDSDFEYLSPIEAIDLDLEIPLVYTGESKATQKWDHWSRLRRSPGVINDGFGDAEVETNPIAKSGRPSWKQILQKAALRSSPDTRWSRLKKDASWSRF